MGSPFEAVIEANDSSQVAVLLAALLLTLTVAAASVTDLRRRVIPNRLTAAAGLVGIVLAAFEGGVAGALAATAFGVMVALPLLVVALARPDGMGMGDVKLVVVIGIYLGITAWTALLVALGLAALTGAMISLSTRTPPALTALPLAPFLACGAVPVAWLATFGLL